MPRFVIIAIGLGVILTTAARAQRAAGVFLRLEAGSLSPDHPLETTLALGGSAGWPVAPHGAVLVRYLRQSQNRAGTDVGAHARNLLTVNWEQAFGEAAVYHRQARLRAGLGLLFRPLLHTAPVLDAGLEVRYGLAPHWALVANVDDALADLPAQTVQQCFAGVCDAFRFDHKIEHNIGLTVAGEWRR